MYENEKNKGERSQWRLLFRRSLFGIQIATVRAKLKLISQHLSKHAPVPNGFRMRSTFAQTLGTLAPFLHPVPRLNLHFLHNQEKREGKFGCARHVKSPHGPQ